MRDPMLGLLWLFLFVSLLKIRQIRSYEARQKKYWAWQIRPCLWATFTLAPVGAPPEPPSPPPAANHAVHSNDSSCSTFCSSDACVQSKLNFRSFLGDRDSGPEGS